MSESENESQPRGSSEVDPEMSESENKSQPCGSSEVDREMSESENKSQPFGSSEVDSEMSESENKSQPCGSSEVDREMSESENKSQPFGSSEIDSEMSESENKSQPCGSSEVDPEMSESENKSQPCGSSEVDPRQKSVSVKKDSISNAVPLCLPNNYTWDSVKKKISVDKKKPRKTLEVCEDGLKLLESLKDQLLVVLCIAGPARSGKSFIASQLQEDVTFDVGHGAGSHTTGIWIGVGATRIHVGNDEARLVILDAEGLGGVNTDNSATDEKWEHKVFSLCVLLSSYVIYNCKGPPNNDVLDKLGFIAEFSRSIFREGQKDAGVQQTPSVGFGQFGPDFLWLFRDMLGTPDFNGEPCDWTDFVNKALLDPKNNEPKRNNIRKSIISTFRTIRAADLPSPTFDSDAVKNLLGEENKDKINPQFRPRIEKVVKEIISSVQIKNMKGSELTGKQLIDILSHVVKVVNSECDKLDVTSMWDGIVNAEMQRYIQSALDLYKEKMEQVELPENEKTYLKLHESTKDSSKVHFEKVTTRFDKDICSSKLQVLCDKIETEFNNSFLKKNEQASLIFNNMLNTDLEKKYFNSLPAKPSCMQLKSADERVNDCYKEKAKGPKAEHVKSEAQLLRDQKIDIMRTESLIDAEQQSCELFEKSLKKALEREPLTLSELNALKETCTNGCFNNFRKTSCNDVKCIHCIKSKESLGQKVKSVFKECYDKSEKACQNLINKLMKRKLLPFVENFDSHNFSDFLQIRDEILAQYDKEAKGLAKGDLRGTCTETIDMQKEEIQHLTLQSALEIVYCEYTQTLNQTAISDPCEDEELNKMQVSRRGI
ncbi:putative guanylate-binding protein 3-like [Apostichopus japonicus]|uniref:Putative guanylate-binding protein 3-like n=1 Tax=Stichopus japonicus TaxID=307972 RepID=A0A2G8LHV5_STIJA|nr:putative guanylate-binding protein 3-like [Apostichopus japonicus]